MGPRAQAFHVQREIVVYYSCALFIEQIKTENIITSWSDFAEQVLRSAKSHFINGMVTHRPHAQCNFQSKHTLKNKLKI